MTNSKTRFFVLLGAFGLTCSAALANQMPDYKVADPDLKVVQIDSSPDESFLSVRVDSGGQIFVGGREAIFVYQPDDLGGYRPRRELLRFPKDTWIYDIEVRGPDLYLTTINAVYVVPDGVVKTEGLTPKRLIWGIPYGHVHQGIHSLAWGPEGDLYISMGDPLWYYGDFKDRPDHWGHWTFFQPDGTKVPYTGMGGVLRCRSDGSRLQVVARGTRNSCGLVFDRNWNLFTNDNDHESMPAEYVPGRLLHVTPHSFLGWPRGWMLSKTPDRADLLQDMFEGLGRCVPVGQTYYDERFLPEKYRHNLLVARWGNRTVSRYPLHNNGATFETEEFTVLEGKGQARPVGVTVGRGGRLFVTIAYMANNELSPIYKSDLVMITRADDGDTHPFRPLDATTASFDQLSKELDSTSWQQRYRAHQELLRRGPVEDANQLTETIDDHPNDSTRQLGHRLWLAASNGASAAELIPFVGHESVQLRLQAVRALAEFHRHRSEVRESLLTALTDSNPQVQHAAVIGFFEQDGPLPQELIDGPARSGDTYLRQAATMLLARKATLEYLGELCTSDDSLVRLAGTLASGFRLTVPRATAPLAEHLPLQPWNTEEAYLPTYFDGQVDLRKLGRVGVFSMAEHWKVGHHTTEQRVLFELLSERLADPDSQVQLQAAYFLSLLNDPQTEPLVAKVRNESDRKKLLAAPVTTIVEAWVAGPFADLGAGLKTIHALESEPIDLSTEYQSDDQTVTWQKLNTTNFFEFQGVTDASFYAHSRLQSGRKQPVMLVVDCHPDDGVRVWLNGQVVMTNEIGHPEKPDEVAVMVELEPGSNDLLVRTNNTVGGCAMRMRFRSLDKVVATLPENLGMQGLAARLAAAGDGPNTISPEFFDVDWLEAARRGDIEQGRKLFSADGIGCAKCHAIGSDASGTGAPSLVDAGKRFTVPHLVESILLPSKQISPIFRGTMVITAQGKIYNGLVVEETADHLELLLPDATRVKIPIDDIDERIIQDISPMPSGTVKTPKELQDLLAFILTSNQ